MRIVRDHRCAADDRRRHDRRRRLRGRGRRPRRRRRRRCSAARPRRGAPRFKRLARRPRRRAPLARRRARRARRVRRRARARRGRRRRTAARASSATTHAVLGAARTTSTTRSPAALVEGTVLAAYRFDRYRSHRRGRRRARGAAASAPTTTSARRCEVAAIVAEAQNRARDLQNTPGQRADARPRSPTARTSSRRGRAASTVEVLGRERDRARRDGRLRRRRAGLRRRSRALITLRYEGPDARRPAARRSSARRSRSTAAASRSSPAAKMSEMKFDMSRRRRRAGGDRRDRPAAAADPRARRRRRDREHAERARDASPATSCARSNGTTIEIINTDAEGRLVLADCLAHARRAGRRADRRPRDADRRDRDALGTTLRRPDEQRRRLGARGRRRPRARSRRARLAPAAARRLRRADQGPLRRHRQRGREPQGRLDHRAPSSSHRFVGDVPWAHLDIAGTAWDTGRAYAPKGGSGWGVRLLVGAGAAAGETDGCRGRRPRAPRVNRRT